MTHGESLRLLNATWHGAQQLMTALPLRQRPQLRHAHQQQSLLPNRLHKSNQIPSCRRQEQLPSILYPPPPSPISTPTRTTGWLSLPPDSTDPWEEEALKVLVDVWSTHMNSRLQQWMAKHGGVELSATANDLARQPMSNTKRRGIVAVLKGTRTPPRVFTNLNQ